VALVLLVFSIPSTLHADNQAVAKGLVTRTYQVSAGFFWGDPTVESATSKSALNVRANLERRGIRFAAGSSATYSPANGRLVLVNNADQIKLFEALVNSDK
jgi:hypothetical protein